ncbi:4035_t:CDS:2 [Funneliformis geosporum]|uniref:triacylglycerol lipase n=1 Tax=Funneliformis geosporum TaxID=1117311 RepID=A0A9W4WXM7_9GLOM|nr:4035_t:CDS:2 [Funneliformis geosporum]CAI2179847.1 14604_t:CDS:2 [Funneliformis geosporum]
MRGTSLFKLYLILSQYIISSFAAFPRQIPLVSNNNNIDQRIIDISQTHTSSQPQIKTNTKILRLKQIFHHGVNPSTKQLFKKLIIKDIENELHTTSPIFNEHVINSIFIDNSKENGESINGLNDKEIPARNKNTVMSMAKMSYDAYIELETFKDKWIDLDDNWNELPFGWDENGIRGYVFSDKDNKTVIVAIKGTNLAYINLPHAGKPLEQNDKLNDNLMFSCCCAKVDRTWKGVCGCYKGGWNCEDTCLSEEAKIKDSYYNIALKIFEKVKADYSNANTNIYLTGHSLGGSLASLLAINYNLPAFAYQAPGELLYAKRLGLNTTHHSHIYHFGHTADPIFMGVCNGVASACYHWGYAMETKCHVGLTCLYDTKSKLGWKSNIFKHEIVPFIEKVIDKWQFITNGKEEVAECFKEENCEDCKNWNFF